MLALGLVASAVLVHTGGADLRVDVEIADGTRSVANTFAAIDHPFHAARAETLRRSLADGQLLRWVSHHQGGYPVEFYPLGVAWLEVAVNALSFGALTILGAHQLVVWLLFFLPSVAYWLLARGDRLSPAVAFLAFCLHLAIPGDWTHGGYTELVGWGLVTNAGGAIAVLIAVAALARYALVGGASMLVIAVGMGAAAAYVNPRSLFGLAVAALAIGLSGLLPVRLSHGKSQPARLLRRLALASGAMLLLAAPEIVPLIRYRDLYQFLHYQSYERLREYWEASVLAVSRPVLLLAILGGVMALLSARFPVTRAIALAAVGYVGLTVFLTNVGSEAGPIQQLETPRLMPFQRLLTLYLAAFGAFRVLAVAARVVRLRWLAPVLAATAGVLALLATSLPLSSVPPAYRAFAEVETTGNAEFVAFREAIEAADAVAAPGTSIHVIGSRLSWHEQLWAPFDTEHPLYYDDWLWYWHDRHDGPFVYTQGHFYPSPAEALTRDYFETHAVGAVVVTDRPTTGIDEAAAAADRRELTLVSDGVWRVFAVEEPAPLATIGGDGADRITVEPHRVDAIFDDAPGGQLVVRQNWFPRWEATVNGASVSVTRRADGYMAIDVPPGRVELALTYGLTTIDWLARGAALVGVVATAMIAWVTRRRGEREEAVRSEGAAI